MHEKVAEVISVQKSAYYADCYKSLYDHYMQYGNQKDSSTAGYQHQQPPGMSCHHRDGASHHDIYSFDTSTPNITRHSLNQPRKVPRQTNFKSEYEMPGFHLPSQSQQSEHLMPPFQPHNHLLQTQPNNHLLHTQPNNHLLHTQPNNHLLIQTQPHHQLLQARSHLRSHQPPYPTLAQLQQDRPQSTLERRAHADYYLSESRQSPHTTAYASSHIPHSTASDVGFNSNSMFSSHMSVGNKEANSTSVLESSDCSRALVSNEIPDSNKTSDISLLSTSDKETLGNDKVMRSDKGLLQIAMGGLPREEWLPQEGLAFEGRSWDKVVDEKEETANPSIAVSNGDEILEFSNKPGPSFETETSTEVLHDNDVSCDDELSVDVSSDDDSVSWLSHEESESEDSSVSTATLQQDLTDKEYKEDNSLPDESENSGDEDGETIEERAAGEEIAAKVSRFYNFTYRHQTRVPLPFLFPLEVSTGCPSVPVPAPSVPGTSNSTAPNQ
ncbi:hypothetical protein EB796_018048 [Bugula neritina]|uniref:Uncharacterized protein n=1 Tax=Bugula neritina TaxID=10212 RepID=A0A7J7JDE8_BUGNE|nr:hypothetical protein EB796_018048 [Bugula neritina]